MARVIDRQGFSKRMQGSSIDVDQLTRDRAIRKAVVATGGDVKDLARADLDRDGAIRGAAEVDTLLRAVDRLETKGPATGVSARDAASTTRPAGEVLDRLDFLARKNEGRLAADASVPSKDLQRGATGAQVKKLQQALVKLGHLTQAEYRTGPGIFGPRTEDALREFQAAHKLKVTGEYGSRTREALSRALTDGPTAEPAGERTRAAGADPAPAPEAPPRGMPNTKGLSTAKRYALYARYIEQHGDKQARQDLAAGKRVLVGLRQDTPMTRDRPRLGTYDDRIVVLWKDKDGPHVKELAANTEPNRRWAEPANRSSKPVGRLADNQTVRYHRARNANFGDHLQPYGSPYAQRDQDRDYKFEKGEKKFKGDWGGQAMFIHRAWAGNTGSQGCQTMEEGRFNEFWRSLGRQRDFSYVLVNVSRD